VGLAAGCWLGLPGCGAPRVARPPIKGAERVVMAPLNLAVRLPPVLEDAVEPVETEMIHYFQERDTRVAVIWPPDAWDLWRDSVAVVSGSGRAGRRFDEAVGRFVRELADHADFQLFVLPSLVYRGARVRGRTAQWDGVRRRVTARGVASARAGLDDPGSEAGDANWTGEIPAMSLHVLVFTPDGRKVYEGWGGLALTHAPTLSSGRRFGGQSLALQPEFFSDRGQIREGIAVALDPYAGDSAP